MSTGSLLEKSNAQPLILRFIAFLLNFNRTFAAEKSTLNSHYTHMESVRPDEISAILRQQLAGTQTEAELEEVGTVLQIGDGVARIYGLSKVQAGELLSFDNGLQAMALNLEEDNVGAVLLGDYSEIKEGDTVKRTNQIAYVKVGEGILGRVVNTLGLHRLTGMGPIQGETFEMPLERKAPGVIYRQPVTEPLQTGIKAIDAMIPIGRGQRELIIGDRQTGKSAVAIDTIINQKEFYDKGEPVLLHLCSLRPKSLDHQTRRSKHSAKPGRWNTPLS